MKRKWGLILWGAATGIIVSVGGLILAAKTSCGLCTHITFAQLFFPYALIADPSLSHFALDAFLAGIQWPAYGAIIGMVLTSSPKKKALVVIVVLAAVHALSVVGANRRVNNWWEFKRIAAGVAPVYRAI